MTDPKHVIEGALVFAERELLPSLGGWQLGVAAAALLLARNRAEHFLAGLSDNKIVRALGLTDEEGFLDTAAAAKALKESIRQRGKLELDLPLFGIQFKIGEKDVDALCSYIGQAAGA